MTYAYNLVNAQSMVAVLPSSKFQQSFWCQVAYNWIIFQLMQLILPRKNIKRLPYDQSVVFVESTQAYIMTIDNSFEWYLLR